jgi:DNA polymerase
MEMMRAIPHTCSEQELFIHCLAAKKIIDKYREAASPVVNLWELCNSLVRNSMYQGFPYVHKCLTFDKERILLPSGLALKYPDLTGEADNKGRIQWVYGVDAKSRRKLYGGKIVENVVQAVARCVMTDGMLRIQKRYSCVLTVHDEVVCLVPENEAKEAEQWVLEQMIKDPSYMPGIPLDAETGCNKRYGEAK